MENIRPDIKVSLVAGSAIYIKDGLRLRLTETGEWVLERKVFTGKDPKTSAYCWQKIDPDRVTLF